MFNKFLILLIIIGFSFSCTNYQLKNGQKNEIPLDNLIDQLPTEDSVKSSLTFNAILEYGDTGVSEICRELESPDQKIREQARWALHGLAMYVTESSRENQRQVFISGLKESLTDSLSNQSNRYLINQIALAGRDESVIILKPYLRHPSLYEPAIAALTAIGTNAAGSALFEALPLVEENAKISMVYALGQIMYEPAGLDVMILLDQSDDTLVEAAVYAVSNMGYEPAQNRLKILVLNNEHYVSDYLILAERLGERKKVTPCLVICDEIINGNFSENNIIHALTLQKRFNPQEAKNSLFEYIPRENRKIRLAALDLLEGYNQAEYVPQLIDLCRNSTVDIQTDIIYKLGTQKCVTALPYIQELSISPLREIRFSAYMALWDINETKSLPDMAVLMKDSLEESEARQIQNILNSLSDSSSIELLMKSFTNFSPDSKSLMLMLLSKRKISSYNQYFLGSLNSTNKLVRQSSLKGLEQIGDDSCLDPLVLFLINSEDEDDKNFTSRSIKSILNRSNDKIDLIIRIRDHYEKATVDGKINLFDLFKLSGESEFLEIAIGEIDNQNETVSRAALLALTNWPNEGALNSLIEIGKENRDSRSQTLALRGALRILNESQMDDQRKISYNKDLADIVKRPEEKRLMLSGLAGIKTVSSLEMISSFLKDTEVNQEAFLALLSVSSSGEEGQPQISREEIVVGLVGPISDEELKDKIETSVQDDDVKPQPPEGYIALFNGNDLEGWQVMSDTPDSWLIKDNILLTEGEGGGWLSTSNEFSDFKLELEFKMSEGGNSGVFLRAPHEGDPAYTGIEIQLLDDYSEIYSQLKSWQYTGSMYGLKSTSQRVSKEAGEWQKMEIHAEGPRINVFLNDVQIINANLIDYMHQEKEHPGIKRRGGFIGLQNHNTKVEFRNIKIREIKK